MKKLITLLAILSLSLSCSKDNKTDNQQKDPQAEIGEEKAQITLTGLTTSDTSFTPQSIDDLVFRDTYQISMDLSDDYSVDFTLLTKGGFEPGTSKTIGETDGIDFNEATFYDGIYDEFYHSTSGVIKITAKKDYELYGGNGYGVALSGTINVVVKSSGGQEITITGTFTDVKVLIES